jgi:hypothetical protein
MLWSYICYRAALPSWRAACLVCFCPWLLTSELHVQGKARLGQVVHKKTATALALTVVKNEDQREFAKLVESVKQMYNDGPRVSWGGGIMGAKSQVWKPASTASNAS